jgi:hypothetical protein
MSAIRDERCLMCDEVYATVDERDGDAHNYAWRGWLANKAVAHWDERHGDRGPKARNPLFPVSA